MSGLGLWLQGPQIEAAQGKIRRKQVAAKAQNQTSFGAASALALQAISTRYKESRSPSWTPGCNQKPAEFE